MRLGAWIFEPALVPSLAAGAMLAVLLSLGFWQLDRARQKEELQSAFASRTALPAVPIADLELAAPVALYRKVTAAGRYDERHQVLLDNRVEDGKPGYDVFTPLRVPGMGRAILVNRGWVPLGASRQQLPHIAIARLDVAIEGWIGQPANPGLRLGPESTSQEWPRVVQYVDYGQLAASLGYRLAPAVILLDSGAVEGYRRVWRPHVPGFGPERHRGYAVSWFALAATLIVIYAVVNTRPLRRAEDARE